MFFGISGSNNNINVLERSPYFKDILEGRSTLVNFAVGTDGIYLELATFVKLITLPQNTKSDNFGKRQI